MEWTRGPTIGRGATATVHLATDTRSGELFAVKSAEFSHSSSLQKEQSFLSKLASPRIVNYLGFSLTTENNTPMYNLLIEYAPKGTLFDTIRSKARLDESVIKLYTLQILQGLDHLQQSGLVHCDIKTRNVLIGEDGAKIADLGCAKSIFDDPNCAKFSGTPAFMAPEVARGERQGFEADIWALGCMIIEMATGVGPWPEMGDFSVVSGLYRIGYSGNVPEFPKGFSEEGKDFLSKCLERDWKQRWCVKELLDHPYVQVLELRSEQELKAKMTSPSSVLDKGLWDFMEGSDQSHQELGFEKSSVLSSARERVKVLVGTECFSDWCFGEDWLTIRSNGDCEDIEDYVAETIEDELIAETSVGLVHHDDEEEAFDRFIFGSELSFDHSIEMSSNIFSDGTFVMPCNHIDFLNEMHNETFHFESISLCVCVFPFHIHLLKGPSFFFLLSHDLSSYSIFQEI